MGRIWALLILVIVVLAVMDVWRREYSLEKRLLWTVVIVVFPVVGALAWYAVSRRIINL
jgi:hypothetical protein